MQSTKQASPLATGPSGTLRVACDSRDTVPSSQLLEVPCPSPLSQTLSNSSENPGTTAAPPPLEALHCSLRSATKDWIKGLPRPYPPPHPHHCYPLSLSQSQCQSPYHGQAHSASVSPWTSAPSVLCQLLQVHSLLLVPIGNKQAHARDLHMLLCRMISARLCPIAPSSKRAPLTLPIFCPALPFN